LAASRQPSATAIDQSAIAQTPSKTESAAPAGNSTAVVMNTSNQIKVPSLVGLTIRKVIETAANAGLPVEVSGRGTVREQAPAAGTFVNAGTRIVVRGSR
jgi:cell division protein FtsI (penicillin-binding protein 3)